MVSDSVLFIEQEGNSEEVAVIYSISPALIFCLDILKFLYNVQKIRGPCFETLAVIRKARWWN